MWKGGDKISKVNIIRMIIATYRAESFALVSPYHFVPFTPFGVVAHMAAGIEPSRGENSSPEEVENSRGIE